MPKRPRVDSRSESADVFFEQLFSVANAYKPNRVALSSLKEWKQRFLSLEAGKKQCIRTPAKKFTFDEAVRDFGLTYSIGMNDVQTWWMIETLPEVKNFQPSASIGKVPPWCYRIHRRGTLLVSLLDRYIAIYDRSSESACRVAVDFLLCECIAVMVSWLDILSDSTYKKTSARHGFWHFGN
jgi:hypothetical protein